MKIAKKAISNTQHDTMARLITQRRPGKPQQIYKKPYPKGEPFSGTVKPSGWPATMGKGSRGMGCVFHFNQTVGPDRWTDGQADRTGGLGVAREISDRS